MVQEGSVIFEGSFSKLRRPRGQAVPVAISFEVGSPPGATSPVTFVPTSKDLSSSRPMSARASSRDPLLFSMSEGDALRKKRPQSARGNRSFAPSSPVLNERGRRITFQESSNDSIEKNTPARENIGAGKKNSSKRTSAPSISVESSPSPGR